MSSDWLYINALIWGTAIGLGLGLFVSILVGQAKSMTTRGLILASYPENLAQGQGRQRATTARSNWSHAYSGLGTNSADRAKSAACSCRVAGRVAWCRRRALVMEPSSRAGLGLFLASSAACAASSRGRRS